MNLQGVSVLVTGGASGLGLATARELARRGARVVIGDLPASAGQSAAAELGPTARFVAADVTDPTQMQAAVDAAAETGAFRACVHCAGRAATVRVVDKEGNPGSLSEYEAVIRLNLVGSFNVLRLAAAAMAKNDPIEGELGTVVLTASIAGYEGQIGQSPYTSSKAGVIGLTLVAARDLATRLIRVCTIAPGTFDTPLLASLPESVRASLGAAVPNPARLGRPEEFAKLAVHILENAYLNGETIRLDGALRMGPR
ncbi:MAG: SDR family NAD(P)-dependent oxidoreductase [Acetobacteraceae bacterium]|nr:SDR family NAD(P)-dependent oxidoreductase [Acetobacteraceae bacterium]